MGELVLAVAAVLVGATLQRSTGLGFALVAGPFLALVLDPYQGVALANLLSLVTCLLVLASTWRHADLRVAALLSAGVVVAIVPGAALARALPDAQLFVLVGGLAVVASLVVALGRPVPGLGRPAGAVATGFASGFSNVTAGIGGPPLAVYGASTRLAQLRFVATVQLVGLLTNALSLLAKRDAELPAPLVLTCLAGVLLGALLGRWTSRYVGDVAGRRLVLALAVIGGLGSVVKGVLSW